MRSLTESACSSKKDTLQRELVDLNEIIREMLLLVHSEATQFAVFVRTELAADLPQIMGDRVQLQQVLMNLMMNSIDAMKDVDGTRELTIKSQRDENGQVLISVSDTGVGLPPQQADKIFNAFFTTKTQGTGMGCGSAAPLLNRTVAACGLPTTLRAAQFFVSHYLPTTRHATQMSQEIALELLTEREAAECLKTRSVALLGNDGPTGGLFLKRRFRFLSNRQNNALIASNASVLIGEC